MSLTQSITASQLGKLQNKFSKSNLLRTAFILYGISLLLFLVLPSIWLLPIASVVFGMAQGINVPNVQSLLAKAVSIEQRAVYMSVNRMVSQVGQFLGPVIAGLFFTLAGLDGVFLSGAAIAFATFFIVFMTKE